MVMNAQEPEVMIAVGVAGILPNKKEERGAVQQGGVLSLHECVCVFAYSNKLNMKDTGCAHIHDYVDVYSCMQNICLVIN